MNKAIVGVLVVLLIAAGWYIYSDMQKPAADESTPVNVGDAGEGAGENQDIQLAVTGNIEGVWVSDSDPNFTREFKVGGIAVDTYDGGADEGTWEPFTDESGIETAFPQEPGVVYIRMVFGGEAFHFKLAALTPEKLELVYMDRGGALSFTRAQ